MRPIATAVSVLLHPLWMPAVLVGLGLWLDPHIRMGLLPQGLWILCGMVLVMTGLFPLTSVLLMQRSGLVSHLTLPEREERLPVYVLTLIYYGMAYWLLRRTLVHPALLGFFFGALVAVLAVLFINLRWKISAHMTALGGVAGALLGMMALHGVPAGALLVLVFVLLGVLGSARLLVSDHTPAQVYTGALLGAACVYACGRWGLSF
jgi:hypothetical protein